MGKKSAEAKHVIGKNAGKEIVEDAATDRLFTRPSDSRTEAFITGRFG